MATRDTESLYKRLIFPVEDRMVRSIARVLPKPEDAGEAMQNATIKILSKLDAIQNHPNPTALILRICIDEALAIVRRQCKEPLLFMEVLDDQAEAANRSPDRLTIFNEMELELLAAISQLPSQQGQAVYQRLVLDHDYREIAAGLACSEESVRQHVARGRKRLASALSHWLESSTQHSS